MVAGCAVCGASTRGDGGAVGWTRVRCSSPSRPVVCRRSRRMSAGWSNPPAGRPLRRSAMGWRHCVTRAAQGAAGMCLRARYVAALVEALAADRIVVSHERRSSGSRWTSTTSTRTSRPCSRRSPGPAPARLIPAAARALDGYPKALYSKDAIQGSGKAGQGLRRHLAGADEGWLFASTASQVAERRRELGPSRPTSRPCATRRSRRSRARKWRAPAEDRQARPHRGAVRVSAPRGAPGRSQKGGQTMSTSPSDGSFRAALRRMHRELEA